MSVPKKTLKICRKGHEFYKSSSCLVCPICEKEKDVSGFLSLISAPARRALESKGIKTLVSLSKYSESELLLLHGFDPGSLPKLRAALKTKGLKSKK